MNTIIVGCGKVGRKLAEQLSQEEGQNITVVDIKSNIVQQTTALYDIMGVVGSGASFDILREAGVETADLLIAVTNSDELNLLTCLIARKAGNCKTIARVRKPEYSKEANMFKEDLGLAMIINPEQTAANEIARLLSFPSAIQIDTFAKGRVEILKCKVSETSVLDGLKISDISSKLKCDVLVCGVERGEETIIPRGDFVIQSGDLISIVAPSKDSSYFFKKIGIKANKVNDTIIVGGGDTAFYLAQQLLNVGINVKIIEVNPERCDELCQLLPKATIINGDGSDNMVLLEEGIENAHSFVALTNIDEENIVLSLFAKSKMQGKVITKINRVTYDEIINKLDLDTVINPKNLTAEYIVRFVRARKNSPGSKIETLHRILGGKAEALEFKIRDNSPVLENTIGNLNIKKNVIIAGISRGGKFIIPRGNDVISKGDTVIVVSKDSGLEDISDILN